MTTVPPPTFRVVLRHAGRSRLELMKLIRARRPEVGLAEAQGLVAPGQVILPRIGHFEVDRVRRELDRLGAHYEIAREGVAG